MRKLLPSLIIFGLLLAACGSTETPAASPTEAPAAEPTATEPPAVEEAAEEAAVAETESESAVENESEAESVAVETGSETETVEEVVVEETTVEEPVELLSAITTGIAQNIYPGEVTSDCTNTNDFRTGNYGELTDDNGNVWMVPAPVAGGFTNVDVYNDCTGSGENDYESELTTQVIDEGGTEITGYVFADNYYEMYVNGTFTGRDAVNFTTFNTHAVQFQAEYPMTYAFLLVDWEEYNGIGMEELRGYHAGDGGFIANFSDGTSTNDDWVCKSFYVAPLDDAGACLAFDEHGNVDSSGCASSDQAISCISNDPENTCNAYLEQMPSNWMESDFDDSNWPAASRYTADDVTNQVGFRNYEDTLFGGVNFVWSSNLVLDNAVVCRLTVQAP